MKGGLDEEGRAVGENRNEGESEERSGGKERKKNAYKT